MLTRCAIHVEMFGRHHGPVKADLLQQFVADQLLGLPQVPAIDPQSLSRFLARTPQHKVTVMAFSSATRASIPLRHAAQQHEHFIVAGRVQWRDEVTITPHCQCRLNG